MKSDNDSIGYVVKEVDPKTGMVGYFVPTLFYAAASELGIRTQKRIIMFSAAWTFCGIAHRVLEEIPQQATYTDEVDTTVNLRQILDSTLNNYGGVEINDVMKFMPDCRKLAFRRHLLWNGRFQAWLDTAGKSYNEVTREEKALNTTD